MNIFFAFIVGYFFGSIPFAYIFTKFAGLPDIREQYSGNVGTSNVVRVGGKKLAILTLLCDILKGFIPVIVVISYNYNLSLVVALGCLIGHIFPIWLKFRGGKGVATFGGCLMALSWQASLLFLLIYIVIYVLSRYASLCSLLATLLVSIYLGIFEDSNKFLLFCTMTLIIWVMHRKNIMRLLTGKEYKA